MTLTSASLAWSPSSSNHLVEHFISTGALTSLSGIDKSIIHACRDIPDHIMSAAIFRVQEHSVPTSHIREYPRATVNDQEVALQLAVKQYTPRESFKAKNEATVIGAHANGFPKVHHH